MHLKFWGVRGSIASPGSDTAEVGGNTSCVEVMCGKTRIILDAGTGLRRLGDALLTEAQEARTSVQATLLLSHFHWDHIQGIPFFVPLYLPTTKLHVVGGSNGVWSAEETLAHQMRAPVFPVRIDEIPARLSFATAKPGDTLSIGEATVEAAKLNHPGGVLAYRITHEGRSLVYATDTEHYACVDPALVRLARDADLIIYDAQYTPEEYVGSPAAGSKVGWGHSTFAAGVEVARAAGVRRLVLFHHDPRRSDAEVVLLEQRARALFPGVIAAREGMRITMGPDPREETPAKSSSEAPVAA